MGGSVRSGLVCVLGLAAGASSAFAQFDTATVTLTAHANSLLNTTGGSGILNKSADGGDYPSAFGVADAGQTIGPSTVTSVGDYTLFRTPTLLIIHGEAIADVNGGAEILNATATADSTVEIVFDVDHDQAWVIHSVEATQGNAQASVVLLQGETEVFRYENLHVHEITGMLEPGTYTLRLSGSAASDWSTGGAYSIGFFDLEFELAAACPADLNEDKLVDDADFVIFVAAYDQLVCAGSMRHGCPGDLNEDGVVEDADFVVFAAAYNDLMCP